MIPAIEMAKTAKDAFGSFPVFIEKVFPLSFKGWDGNEDGTWLNPPDGAWVPAPHTVRWARDLQENNLTARLCARKHLKSTTFYAHVMWHLFRCQLQSKEGLYLSYKQDLAAYHTANIKGLVKNNPYFEGILDLTDAASYLQYAWHPDEKVKFTVVPEGVMSFKRGRHPWIVWCLTPENKIRTRAGYKSICDIKAGDEVFTHKMRYKEVIDVYERIVDEDIVKLTLENGKVVRLTGNHRVLVEGGWKRADELTESDEKIVKIEKERYKGKVYNLEVEDDHSYAGEGLFYHNCDDILADPKNPLNIATINSVTRAFFEDVMSLPKEGGQLHLAGTPQDDSDLFFQIKKRTTGFFWQKEPAILNEIDGEVVWPELFPYQRLMEIRNNILSKAFNKEYMCSPIRTEEGYFKREEILDVVDTGLENVRSLNTDNDVFAGWDLGKKQHPSHFTVFEIVDGKAIQRYQEFWDGLNYENQLGKIRKMKERLMIDKVAYDATRGELEILEERGEIPYWMEGVTFTNKRKASLANTFEGRVMRHSIGLINDQRMINVILSVDNDLKAIETDEGHGDSFWSIAMALMLAGEPMDKNPTMFMELD